MPSSTTSSYSSSSYSTSSFTCFSATSPSNLQRFLQCVTPHVPSQTLPKVFVSFVLISLSNLDFLCFCSLGCVQEVPLFLSLWADSLCFDSSDGAFVCSFVFIYVVFFNFCHYHMQKLEYFLDLSSIS